MAHQLSLSLGSDHVEHPEPQPKSRPAFGDEQRPDLVVLSLGRPETFGGFDTPLTFHP